MLGSLTHVQIIEAVVRDHKQLQFYRDPSVPRDSVLDDFYALVESCTTSERAERPTAAEAERKLRLMLARCSKATDEAMCPLVPMGMVPPRCQVAALARLPDDGARASTPPKP